MENFQQQHNAMKMSTYNSICGEEDKDRSVKLEIQIAHKVHYKHTDCIDIQLLPSAATAEHHPDTAQSRKKIAATFHQKK